MDEILARIGEDLAGRITGPLTFRLILQPLVAIGLAIHAGIADGRAGRPPYFWALMTRPGQRRQLLKEGWASVAKVFAMAVAIDIVYQLIVFRWVYPFEAFVVAFVLACVPYMLLRGPAARLAHRTAGA